MEEKEDWDVITATAERAVIWRSYRDCQIVATGDGELPEGAALTTFAELLNDIVLCNILGGFASECGI